MRVSSAAGVALICSAVVFRVTLPRTQARRWILSGLVLCGLLPAMTLGLGRGVPFENSLPVPFALEAGSAWMRPHAATLFALCCLGLGVLLAEFSERSWRWVTALVYAAGAVASASATYHSMHLDVAGRFMVLPAMSLPSTLSIGFVALALGLQVPGSALAHLATSRSGVARLFKGMVFAALLVPILSLIVRSAMEVDANLSRIDSITVHAMACVVVFGVSCLLLLESTIRAERARDAALEEARVLSIRLEEEVLQRTEQLQLTTVELRRMALAAQLTTNAVILTDQFNRIEWVNPGFERLTGYTLEEVVGKCPSELLHGPDTDSSAACRMRDALLAGLSYREEVVNYRRDGRPYWVAIEGHPEWSTEGKLQRFVSVQVDVTERRRMEQELRKAQARTQSMIEALPGAVYEFHRADDGHRSFRFFSQGLRDVCGIDADRALADPESLFRQVLPEDLQALNESIIDSARRLSPWEHRYRIKTESGEIKWLLGRSTPRRAEGGVLWTGLLVDVTRLKRLEDEAREAEQLLQDAGKLAKLGGWRLDPVVGRPVWTDETYRIHEIPVGSEVGLQQALEFYLPEDRARVIAAVEAAVSEARAYDLTTRLVTAKGKRLWVRALCRPEVRDGRVVMLHGVFQDVTEMRLAQERYEAAESRWRFALEGAGDGVWDWNIPTGTVFFSDQWKRMLGYSPDEVRHHIHAWESLVHPEDAPAVRAALQAALSGAQEAYSVETRLRRKDGTYCWVLDRGRVVERAPDGSPLRMIGTHSDLTKRRAEEEERRLLERKLGHSQKLETLGTLAGGIAHDFNNLLTGISGFIELALRSDSSTGEISDHLSQAKKGCATARDLVKRLLLFSRRAPESQRQVFSMRSLVQDTMPLVSAVVPACIQVRLDAGSGEDSVHGDPAQLQQVLMNLCVNAAHAIGECHGTISVAVATQALDADFIRRHAIELKPGNYLCLSVADTGCGMDPDTLRRIFDPFFTTRPQGEGTGLGLSIAHGIVHDHGGGLLVSSTPGSGSVFSVYLPLTNARPSSLQPVPTEAPVRVQGMRALLIEDDPSVSRFAEQALRRFGFVVAAYSRAAVAVARLEMEPANWSLVLLDLSMPGMTGMEALPRIRALAPELPVVLMSGDMERFGSGAWQKDPQVSLLNKPFTLAELEALVRARCAYAPDAPVHSA